MLKKPLDLVTLQEIVKAGFAKTVENLFTINSRYKLPIVFEFDEDIYENDYYLNDEGKNEYASNSWFSVFFYSKEMDENTNCLSISPSNHPGRDFIIINAEKLARCFRECNELVSKVVYTVDSKYKPDELAMLLENGKGIIPEYNIHFIMDNDSD